MKICIIAGLYKDEIVGGGEIYVQNIVERLAENNEVIVITTSPNDKLKPRIYMDKKAKIYSFRPIFTIYNINNISSYKALLTAIFSRITDVWNIHSYLTLLKILTFEKPDVIHTHNIDHISTSVFTLTKMLKIPCVHTCHSYQLLSVFPSFYNPRIQKNIEKVGLYDSIYQEVKRYLSKDIDCVITPSNFVMDLHTKYGFFKKSKKIVLTHGVDMNNNKLNIRNIDGRIHILYVGRLSITKGLDILIRAFQGINADVQLHIVGQGPEDYYFNNIANNDKRIVFHGFVSEEELHSLYEISHILIVPSVWYEVFGLVILDGFKYGLPVIASNIGGIPDLIIQNYNGYLFKPGDIDDLKNKIQYIIDHPNLLRIMSYNAYTSAKRYNMENHIQRLQEIYSDLSSINTEKE